MRLPRLLQRLLLAAATFVVALLLAEAALRVAGVHVPERGEANTLRIGKKVPEEQVPGLGHRLVPDRASTVEYPGAADEPAREVEYRVNALGFRDREDRRLARPPGTTRLLALGDSFTFGTGVALEDTWPLQLETVLREQHGREGVEVWNAGVYAYDARQAAALLRTRVEEVAPDVVLWCLYVNDASGERGASEQPWEVRWLQRLGLTSGVWADSDRKTPEQERTMRWRRRSRLVDVTCHHLFNALSGRVTTRNYQADWAPDSAGLGKVRTALAEGRQLAADHGFELVVLMYPDLHGLEGAHPFQEIHDRAGALCEGLGLTYVDLTPAVAGLPSESLHAHVHDHHPNAACNLLVARHLAEALASTLDG